MSIKLLSRSALVLVVVCSIARTLAAEPATVGTDGDGVPAGLTGDEEAAWVNAHTPTLLVTGVRE